MYGYKSVVIGSRYKSKQKGAVTIKNCCVVDR